MNASELPSAKRLTIYSLGRIGRSVRLLMVNAAESKLRRTFDVWIVKES